MSKHNYIRKCKKCGKQKTGTTRRSYTCVECKDGIAGSNFYAIRKNKLETEGFCKICLTTKNLHLHHIDQDRTNNTKENLVLLCNQCHVSQHKRKFKTHSRIDYGMFGKRLRYQKSLRNTPIQLLKNIFGGT